MRRRKSVERTFHPPWKTPKDAGADCDRCPIGRWAKRMGERLDPVWPDGANFANLAIVGEGPGSNEVKRGIPFVGPSGEFLEAQLEHFGVARADVWIDNATLCYPPGGDLVAFEKMSKKSWNALELKKPKDQRLPFKTSAECCRARLWKTLRLRLCTACGKPVGFNERDVMPEVRCLCERPKISMQKNKLGAPPKVVFLAGGGAMAAFTGAEGIQARGGYVFGAEP